MDDGPGDFGSVSITRWKRVSGWFRRTWTIIQSIAGSEGSRYRRERGDVCAVMMALLVRRDFGPNVHTAGCLMFQRHASDTFTSS